MRKSTVHSFQSPRKMAAYRPSMKGVGDLQQLKRIGYGCDASVAKEIYNYIFRGANDNLPAGVTTPNIPSFVQFLQAWLPGNVEVVTAIRTIDTLVGLSTVGNWGDEEIVQGFIERLGQSVPYSDNGNAPLANWNWNVEKRTIVRFENAIRVGLLEDYRSAAVRINSGQEKRDAASTELEIARNKVGFYGFNNGDNKTFGFLNEPNLPAYVPVPNGAKSSPLWVNKNFAEIQSDILTGLVALRLNSKGVVDPKRTPITIALATGVVDLLSTTTDFGISVEDWLKKNYPNVRIESAPELDEAVGGLNAAYYYAETVADSGSDNGRTFDQLVPMRFMVTGTMKLTKGYEEGYTNATAGILLKRGYSVYRQDAM